MNLLALPHRPLCVGALIPTVALLAGCIGPLRHVSVDRDPAVPLPPGATWAYRPHEEPSGPDADALLDNPMVHQRLERLLATELTARGYPQVDDASQATLLVDYHLGVKQQQETVVSQHATNAWAPITTCQDRIPERGRDAAPPSRAQAGDRPAPRDTSHASPARDTGRGERRDNAARDNGRADRPDAAHDGNRRDGAKDDSTSRTCTTRLVWGPYGPPETSFRTFTYQEGTIVVDLTDRVSGLVAWRVVGDRRLTLNDESEETLHRVTQRLMRDLPAAGGGGT